MEQEKRGYLKASLWSGIANLIALFFSYGIPYYFAGGRGDPINARVPQSFFCPPRYLSDLLFLTQVVHAQNYYSLNHYSAIFFYGVRLHSKAKSHRK